MHSRARPGNVRYGISFQIATIPHRARILLALFPEDFMAARNRSAHASGSNGRDAPAPQLNLLLATLPADELELILEHATSVKCEQRLVLFEQNDPIDNVYFPLTGLGSFVTTLNDGDELEAMTVGREGFIGLPVFHGIPASRTRVVCQVGGDFLQIPSPSFKTILSQTRDLHVLLHRFAQFTMDSLSQYCACNSKHLIEQRCARWLLTTSDSVDRVEFNVTQEFLSQRLAVRRAGVTVALGALERQGLISHRYGVVKINDVNGLKQAACECFATIQEAKRAMLSDSES